MKLTTEFKHEVDNIILCAEQDPILAYGVKCCDEDAQKLGISFYEMAYQVLERFNGHEEIRLRGNVK